jgi:hypothetical protein
VTSPRRPEIVWNCFRSSSSSSAFRARKRSRCEVTIGRIDVSADDVKGMGLVRAGEGCSNEVRVEASEMMERSLLQFSFRGPGPRESRWTEGPYHHHLAAQRCVGQAGASRSPAARSATSASPARRPLTLGAVPQIGETSQVLHGVPGLRRQSEGAGRGRGARTRNLASSSRMRLFFRARSASSDLPC